ncbi:hypothetical protein GF378_01320 [Candidatus Pacearchaeota archaeon]|nr:hypothetical protein [Candidatus Pacearchaeota archaeon]
MKQGQEQGQESAKEQEQEIQRQIWWNFIPNPGDRNIQYHFAIINDNREIGNLYSRIIKELAPVDELEERKGKAGKLNYCIMSFLSQKNIDFRNLSNIYKGRIKKDERLYDRQRIGRDGLEEYVQKKIQKKLD